jgi:hypothetical protein
MALLCKIMWGVILPVLSLAFILQAEDIQCPKTVQVRQVALDVPAGWTAETDDKSQPTLKSIAFFDGKPEDEASLVYDRMTPSRNGKRAVWSFLPASHIWLACSYTGTAVVLSRPLPNVSRCTVLYKGETEIDRMFCR